MYDFKMSGLCNKEVRGLLKLNISVSAEIRGMIGLDNWSVLSRAK